MKYRKRILLLAVLALSAAFLFHHSVWAGKKISFAQKSLTMTAGESRKLRLSGISKKNQDDVKWKSSNKNIVQTNQKGRVRAKKPGSASVTAMYRGKKYTYRISVVQKADAGGSPAASDSSGSMNPKDDTAELTPGTSYYRDFLVDNVLHTRQDGDIHYNVYFPDSYNGNDLHALFVTLPGYQGLYFQGPAQNIKTEDFGFEARKYNSKMVILAPQLSDWGQTSADQTVALTEYFLSHYKIDPAKVYINGYSGGGETLSLVLDKKPELFAAALMCSSQWDGGYEAVVQARMPVYFIIGENDEYYGSEPFKKAYRNLRELYRKQGLAENEIDRLAVLDVKDSSYFRGTGITYQHGGGYLFCRDKAVMEWLFGHERS